MKHVVFGVLLITSMVAVVRCHEEEKAVPPPPPPLQFIVTFKDANNLRPGQSLIYKGVRIGHVAAVDLAGDAVNVKLVVDENRRTVVYKEAKFSIEKVSLINATGEHQVVMSDTGNIRTPMEAGTVIVGSEGWLSDAANRVKDKVTSAVNSVSAP